MENSYFVFTTKSKPIIIERLHLCTWEFKDNSALVEFGAEIANIMGSSDESLTINFYVPWLTKKMIVSDLYDNLKESENSRFIFNDSVNSSQYLDDGKKRNGVIHHFESRSPLCIMPIQSTIDEKMNIVSITINLKSAKEVKLKEESNLYFRFYLKPDIQLISTRKSGVSRATIIYDIKINEKRNIPDSLIYSFQDIGLCEIKNCFCFNIIPNSYDLTFFDNSALKSLRTLEFDSFNKYLSYKQVKEKELVVVFNKKSQKESYNFFSIYSKERIGTGQFALAVLINLICGVLLFFPAYRKTYNYRFFTSDFWTNLPLEVFIALMTGIILISYFIWPSITNVFKSVTNKANQ